MARQVIWDERAPCHPGEVFPTDQVRTCNRARSTRQLSLLLRLSIGSNEARHTQAGQTFERVEWCNLSLWNSVPKPLGITLEYAGIQCPNDKPYIESFFDHDKTEEVYRTSYTTLAKAQVGWQLYRIWYETERFHESLGYETPHEHVAVVPRAQKLSEPKGKEMLADTLLVVQMLAEGLQVLAKR